MVSAEVVASRKIRVLKTNMAKGRDGGMRLRAEIEVCNCYLEKWRLNRIAQVEDSTLKICLIRLIERGLTMIIYALLKRG